MLASRNKVSRLSKSIGLYVLGTTSQVTIGEGDFVLCILKYLCGSPNLFQQWGLEWWKGGGSNYFSELLKLISYHSLTRDLIWNMDKTEKQFEHRPTTVVGRKGTKSHTRTRQAIPRKYHHPSLRQCVGKSYPTDEHSESQDSAMSDVRRYYGFTQALSGLTRRGLGCATSKRSRGFLRCLSQTSPTPNLHGWK